jgi:hypothetical protein
MKLFSSWRRRTLVLGVAAVLGLLTVSTVTPALAGVGRGGGGGCGVSSPPRWAGYEVIASGDGSPGTLRVEWTAPIEVQTGTACTPVTGYRITARSYYFKRPPSDSEANWGELATVGPYQGSFDAGPALILIVYQYRIYALNAYGASAPHQITATVPVG